jgi:hypothetical protein
MWMGRIALVLRQTMRSALLQLREPMFFLAQLLAALLVILRELGAAPLAIAVAVTVTVIGTTENRSTPTSLGSLCLRPLTRGLALANNGALARGRRAVFDGGRSANLGIRAHGSEGHEAYQSHGNPGGFEHH